MQIKLQYIFILITGRPGNREKQTFIYLYTFLHPHLINEALAVVVRCETYRV